MHTLFQPAMGWTDSHLHRFQPGGEQAFTEPYFTTWHGLPEPLADLVQGLRGSGWSQSLDWLAALGPRGPVALDETLARAALLGVEDIPSASIEVVYEPGGGQGRNDARS